MNVTDLAKHYTGEVFHVERIKNRAANTRANRDAVITAIANTDRDDDSYLAALARELRRLSARLAHDDERVEAQHERFRVIRADVQQMTDHERWAFWAEVDRLVPNCPTFHLDPTDSEWFAAMAAAR